MVQIFLCEFNRSNRVRHHGLLDFKYGLLWRELGDKLNQYIPCPNMICDVVTSFVGV